jgi:two-component system cell cycle sensor histidine kinase/response regulator CckA
MKQILLVDDDRSMLNLLGRALSEYDVTIARNGFEALAAAERLEHLDLIITDYMMPEMFGDELIARARERQPGLQVLVVTGHAEILESIAPPWWQAHPHLEKPFAVKALRERVTALIGEAHPVA